MHLTTYISRPEDGKIKTSLAITVEYDPKDNSVEELISVFACDHLKNSVVNITDIFIMDASKGLEQLISATDWREIYRENSKKAA